MDSSLGSASPADTDSPPPPSRPHALPPLDFTMPTARQLAVARGKAQARGGRGGRSSTPPTRAYRGKVRGRGGQPPSKLRRVATPESEDGGEDELESEDDQSPVVGPAAAMDIDEELESEDDLTTPLLRTKIADDAQGESSDTDDEEDEEGGEDGSSDDEAESEEEDEEGEEEEDADGESEEAEEEEDPSPPAPATTRGPLKIKVKFAAQPLPSPVRGRGRGRGAPRGRRSVSTGTRTVSEDVESEDPGDDDVPLAHKAAAKPTPAEPTRWPSTSMSHDDDEELSPVPEEFAAELERQKLGMSVTPTPGADQEDEEGEGEEEDDVELEEEDEVEEEADEDEEDEDEDEADELAPASTLTSGQGTPTARGTARMTARQAALKGTGAQLEFLELPSGKGKKKLLTEAELELRKAEQSRKRSLQSAQRLEDEKQATIRRLLSKQAPRARTRAERLAMSASAGTTGEAGEGTGTGSGTPLPMQTVPTLARWVSNKDGMLWAVPPEGKWTGRLGKTKAAPVGQDVDMDGTAEVDGRPAPVNELPPPAKCALEGCGALRKYRCVADYQRGACGLGHLKELERMIASGG